MDVLEAMQLDHANFLLMISAPQVIPQAIPYERKLFGADLEAGRTSLVKTRAWLETAKAQLPAGSTPTEIHMHAFLNVLFSLDPLVEEDIHETWHLDHQRVKDIRDVLRTVILGGSIVLTVKTLLRRDVRGAWKEAASCVSTLLRVGAGAPKEVADGVRMFVESTTATPPSTLEAVKTAITRILERGVADPVVRVVCNRLRGFVRERLVERRSAERVRLAAGAGETLAGWGVGEWMGVVGGVVENVGVWVEVDRGVSGEWYNEILAAE